MTSTSPPTRSNRRLMRNGVCLTGVGLLGGLTAAAIFANGWQLPPVAVAALICTALALVLVGFAVMVVAADPFADEELDEPPAQAAGTRGHREVRGTG